MRLRKYEPFKELSIPPNKAVLVKVPKGKYLLPIGKADVLREGRAVTLVAWGTQVHVMLEVADMVAERLGADCEVIDLQSILPWDEEAVAKSVAKTGRLLITHEGLPA
jgi:2-oxoisovalerate dehydrogenase E1 component beta subunit